MTDTPCRIAHVADPKRGHLSSDDCWCEPRIYWMDTDKAHPILVIEHNDEEATPRNLLLDERHQFHDWVTRTLEEVRIEG